MDKKFKEIEEKLKASLGIDKLPDYAIEVNKTQKRELRLIKRGL